MQLTARDVDKFKDAYKRHFGQELSDDEARAELALLVRQVEIVYQPLTVEQFERFLERNATITARIDHAKEL